MERSPRDGVVDPEVLLAVQITGLSDILARGVLDLAAERRLERLRLPRASPSGLLQLGVLKRKGDHRGLSLHAQGFPHDLAGRARAATGDVA